jgi:hypothetical protein
MYRNIIVIRVDELMSDPDFIQPMAIPVMRTSGAFDGHGRWEPASVDTIKLTMVIQTGVVRGQNIFALSEGEQDRDYITVWSADELYCGDGISSRESDVVMWRGVPWRIIASSDRSDNGYYEAIAHFSPNYGGTVAT